MIELFDGIVVRIRHILRLVTVDDGTLTVFVSPNHKFSKKFDSRDDARIAARTIMLEVNRV